MNKPDSGLCKMGPPRMSSCSSRKAIVGGGVGSLDAVKRKVLLMVDLVGTARGGK